MLENPHILEKMVSDTGAKSTDLQSPETVEKLCEKCHTYAADWENVARELWNSKEHKKPRYENYKK
jgi:cytochrome c2